MALQYDELSERNKPSTSSFRHEIRTSNADKNVRVDEDMDEM